MAETKIPISFPTNTVDLQKAIQILKQSKDATEQLRTSSKQLASDTGALGSKYNSTLQGMQERLERLRYQLRNTASDNTAALNKLSAEYKTLQGEIDKTNKKLFEQQKATRSASDSFQQMFTTVKLFITAGIVREIGQMALGMATLAGNVEGVERAFNKLPNAVLLLNQLRRATHGTIDDLTLMQKAVQFQNFRLPLQDLGKYLEFASIRAQQTGESMEYMLNSIITGLGRGSIKILDNLQVNVNAMKKDMAELGITIQEAFGRQVQIEMQRVGGYLETSKTAVEQLGSGWKNLKAELSQKIETSWLTTFLNDVVRGARIAIMSQEELRKFLTEDAAARQADAIIKQKQKELKATQDIEAAIADEIKKREELIRIKDKQIADEQAKIKPENYKNSIFGFFGGQAELNKKAKEQIDFLKTTKAETQQVIDILKAYEVQTYATADAEDDRAESVKELIYQESEEQRVFLEKLRAINEWDREMEDMLKTLNDASNAYEKLKKEQIPTIDIIEDEKEAVQEVLTAWQKYFALFKRELRKKEQLTPEQLADMTKKTVATIFEQQLIASADFEAQMYDQRIQRANEYYDKLITLSGDNDRRRKELELRRDEEIKKLNQQREAAEARAARRKVIIEGAVAIAKTFAQYGFTPQALIAAGLMAAQTASQLSILARAPKGYKHGVIGLRGPGSETSDSIPAMLSRGESVMTASETRANWKTLHKIRAGKINDKVIDRIMESRTVIGADDHQTAAKLDELIRITKTNRPPDYVERAGMLYRVKQKGDNSRAYIRSKYGFN